MLFSNYAQAESEPSIKGRLISPQKANYYAAVFI